MMIQLHCSQGRTLFYCLSSVGFGRGKVDIVGHIRSHWKYELSLASLHFVANHFQKAHLLNVFIEESY